MPATGAHVSAMIAAQMERSADRHPADRRGDLNDRLKAFIVPELVAFLAAEGIRFTGRPKRADVVTEILDIFTPEEN